MKGLLIHNEHIGDLARVKYFVCHCRMYHLLHGGVIVFSELFFISSSITLVVVFVSTVRVAYCRVGGDRFSCHDRF